MKPVDVSNLPLAQERPAAERLRQGGKASLHSRDLMDGPQLNDVGAETQDNPPANDGAGAQTIGAKPALPLPVVLWLAAIASSGTSLMITGIYFYMANRY